MARRYREADIDSLRSIVDGRPVSRGTLEAIRAELRTRSCEAAARLASRIDLALARCAPGPASPGARPALRRIRPAWIAPLVRLAARSDPRRMPAASDGRPPSGLV